MKNLLQTALARKNVEIGRDDFVSANDVKQSLAAFAQIRFSETELGVYLPGSRFGSGRGGN